MEFAACEEQVEVQRGAQARLHCSFNSNSLPVACCWIHNREKVLLCVEEDMCFCVLTAYVVACLCKRDACILMINPSLEFRKLRLLIRNRRRNLQRMYTRYNLNDLRFLTTKACISEEKKT